MDTRISTYLRSTEPFTAVLDDVSDWHHDSPCEGWDAADVVAHVIDTQRAFVAERGVQLDPVSDGTPDQRWREHHRSVEQALMDEDWSLSAYDGYFGPTTVVDTLLTFYGFDLIVHRWDIGRAGGVPVQWTDEEMDRLHSAIEGFGEHLYVEGICTAALEPAADADRQTRLLAQLGRQA